MFPFGGLSSRNPAEAARRRREHLIAAAMAFSGMHEPATATPVLRRNQPGDPGTTADNPVTLESDGDDDDDDDDVVTAPLETAGGWGALAPARL